MAVDASTPREPIQVWTWPTPNGHKVHIMLEELGLPYEVVPINIGSGDQFKPEFLVHHAEPPHPRHRRSRRAGAMGRSRCSRAAPSSIYLAEKTGSALLPRDPATRYRCLQWVMFQMGGVGPMFGQYNHFANYAADKLPYAIERYTNEVARLHRVLEKRLGESAFLAGPDYSIADICTFPWIRNADRRGIDLAVYPAVKRWHDAIAARPAVQRGVQVLADNQRRGAMTDAERENMFGKAQFAVR